MKQAFTRSKLHLQSSRRVGARHVCSIELFYYVYHIELWTCERRNCVSQMILLHCTRWHTKSASIRFYSSFAIYYKDSIPLNAHILLTSNWRRILPLRRTPNHIHRLPKQTEIPNNRERLFHIMHCLPPHKSAGDLVRAVLCWCKGGMGVWPRPWECRHRTIAASVRCFSKCGGPAGVTTQIFQSVRFFPWASTTWNVSLFLRSRREREMIFLFYCLSSPRDAQFTARPVAVLIKGIN